MGLTRPRAYQIFDIDYKQSVRVVSTTNVTLSGGAPASVDGVSLSANDRVLVTGQSTGSENGLYYVTVAGSGSDGTWARSIDGDQTGEIQAGMIVMVTEGTTYADTQWKLVTNDPITIGTTALVFEQNSAAAYGNIYANGTPVIADSVGDTLTLTPGNNLIITGNATSDTVTFAVSDAPTFVGNVTADYFVGNGSQLTGLPEQYGNANVVALLSDFGSNTIVTTGNVTGGNLNTAGQVVATGNVTGGNILTGGVISATGNITGGNLSATNIAGTLTTAAQTNITSVGTLSSLSVTGNITGGNIGTAGELKTTGTFLLGTQQFYAQGSDGFSVNENFNAGNSTVTAYHYTSGSGRNAIVFDTAVTGQFTTGFGTTGTAASNKFVFFAEFGNTFWEWRKSVGIQAPNLNGGTLLANISADGNFWTAGTITGTGNVTGGNLNTAGQVVATGNITGGNIITTGVVTATGNVTGDYFIGNGSQLTGISVSASSISNGTSNVDIPSSSGNVSVAVSGYANTAVFAPNSLALGGPFSTPKYFNSVAQVAANVNAVLISPCTIEASGNIYIPDDSTLTIFTPV